MGLRGLVRAVLRARMYCEQALLIQLGVRMLARLNVRVIRLTGSYLILKRDFRFFVAGALRRRSEVLTSFFGRVNVRTARRKANFIVPDPPRITYRFLGFIRLYKGS